MAAVVRSRPVAAAPSAEALAVLTGTAAGPVAAQPIATRSRCNVLLLLVLQPFTKCYCTSCDP